jgi:hypothetical protein
VLVPYKLAIGVQRSESTSIGLARSALVALVDLGDALPGVSGNFAGTHFSRVFLCCDNRFNLSASSASLIAFFSSDFLAFFRWILVSTGRGAVVLVAAEEELEMEKASGCQRGE